MLTSGNTFQRAIDLILEKDCNGRVLHNIASSYSDDGAVYSTTNDHIDDLTRVLKLLKKGGAVLGLKKCIWCTDEGKFCRFRVVCGRGIKADTEKIEALASMKALPDKAAVESFLSSCVYLSRFVKDYATLTLPSYELEVELKPPLTSLRCTRSDGTPYWSEACERSFKGIEQAVRHYAQHPASYSQTFRSQ